MFDFIGDRTEKLVFEAIGVLCNITRIAVDIYVISCMTVPLVILIAAILGTVIAILDGFAMAYDFVKTIQED